MSGCVTYKQLGQKILLHSCINCNRKICAVIFLLGFSLPFNCLVFCEYRYNVSNRRCIKNSYSEGVILQISYKTYTNVLYISNTYHSKLYQRLVYYSLSL
jgi:hypothetical protein